MRGLLGGATLGGSFLAISPKLREQAFLGAHIITSKLNYYSPYSYIAVAVGLFALITVSLYRSTGLRG